MRVGYFECTIKHQTHDAKAVVIIWKLKYERNDDCCGILCRSDGVDTFDVIALVSPLYVLVIISDDKKLLFIYTIM